MIAKDNNKVAQDEPPSDKHIAGGLYESDILHKPAQEVKAYLEGFNLTMRVMKQDGDGLMGTCDYCLDRLNVEVENGVVVKFLGIG